jgi:hypothetical protein
MSDRIELEPEEIAGLIRGARLLELRVDSELLAFSTLMASELSETSFSARG